MRKRVRRSVKLDPVKLLIQELERRESPTESISALSAQVFIGATPTGPAPVRVAASSPAVGLADLSGPSPEPSPFSIALPPAEDDAPRTAAADVSFASTPDRAPSFWADPFVDWVQPDPLDRPTHLDQGTNPAAGGGGGGGAGGTPPVAQALPSVAVTAGAVGTAAPAGQDPGVAPAAAAPSSAPPPSGGGSPFSWASGSATAPPPVAAGSTSHAYGTFTPATLTHPSYVVDANKGAVLSEAVVNHDFSSWAVDLRAQVSGATVSSYSWNYSGAADATSVSGSSTYRLQFTWGSFTGAERSDAITLTENFSGGGSQSQTFHFIVSATDSPAYESAPTSVGTWPAVITPDMLQSGSESVDGPHHTITLADGGVETAVDLPTYNPNVPAMRLVYNSDTVNPHPIFLTRYELDPSVAVPSTIDASLTVNGTAGATVTYDTSGMNPGDFVQAALQADCSSLATGRYSYSVTVKANYATPVTTTCSGSFTLVNRTDSPYGAGWWVDGYDRIYPGTGGVALVHGDGTSLWFTGSGSGTFTYTDPAGDFTTLVHHSFPFTNWARTLNDGTLQIFGLTGTGQGQLYQVVDPNNNATLRYDASSAGLWTYTDPYNQTTTFSYDTSNKLSSILDPAGRTTNVTVSSGKLSTITDPAGGVWTYAYDTSDRLTTLTDPDNKATTFTYGTSGRVSGVAEADGASESVTPLQTVGLPGSGTTTAVLTAAATASFTDGMTHTTTQRFDWLGFGGSMQLTDPLGDVNVQYRDANGLVWLSADGLGLRNDYHYDGSGNVTRATWANDAHDDYTYNSFAEPLTHTNPINETTTYVYDSHGNLTSVTNALNEITTYTYTTTGQVQTVKDANNHTTTYAYDTKDRLTTVTDPLNHVTTLAYSTAGQVTALTDPNNHTTDFAYDAMNRLTGMTAADGGITTYAYDALGQLKTQTDPLNHTTTYGYDAVGRETTQTDPLNHTTTYAYDYAGNLKTVTDPAGDTTTYTYDAANQQIGTTDPMGRQSTVVYDAGGEVINTIDPAGLPTTFTYNLRKQPLVEQDPSGNTTQYGYCDCGCLTSVDSNATPTYDTHVTYTLDAADQVTAVTVNGETTTYAYDPAGNLTSVTDPNNDTTTYAYTATDQLKTKTDALNHTTTLAYDPAGNQTSVTDPLNHTTTYSYDAVNRLATTEDALAGTTSYTYDLAGRLQTLTDPDHNATNYGYDAAGNRVTATDPNGNTTTTAYDAADRVSEITDRDGRVRDFAYFADGQVHTETWKPSATTTTLDNVITYGYDTAGRMASVADFNSAYNYGYSSTTGQIQTVDDVGAPGLPQVTLTYDNRGLVTKSVQDSLGGRVDYAYDGALRLTNAGLSVSGTAGAQVALTYTGGRLTGVSRQDGTSGPTIDSAYAYDAADRMTSITHTSSYTSSTLSQFTYAYDAADRLTGYTGPEGTRTYAYDNTNQLTGVTDTGTSTALESFAYDANGNRTAADGLSYLTTTGNRMTSDGVYSYTYDNEGNVATKSKSGDYWQYTYDERNRLTNVEELTGIGGTVVYEATYAYDAFDRRIGVHEDANPSGIGGGGDTVTQLWTLYDGANAYADFDGSGALTMRYLNGRGMDERYARQDPSGTVAWYLTDNLGSVRQVVTTTGTVLDSLNYSAFGQIASESNSSYGDRFKYTGREWDGGTNQYYYRARYYAAEAGRFTSEDPSQFAAGDQNLYRYAFNNSLTSTDPSGRQIKGPRWLLELWLSLRAQLKDLQQQQQKGFQDINDKLGQINALRNQLKNPNLTPAQIDAINKQILDLENQILIIRLRNQALELEAKILRYYLELINLFIFGGQIGVIPPIGPIPGGIFIWPGPLGPPPPGLPPPAPQPPIIIPIPPCPGGILPFP